MNAGIEISKKKIFLNSSVSIFAKLLNLTIIVWLQWHLLSRISEEEYALYPVIISIIVFLPLFATVFTAGLGRFITEAYAVGDYDRITQITSSLFFLLLIFGIVFWAGGMVFSWYIDRVLNIPAERIGDAQLMMALLITLFVFRLTLSPFRLGLHVLQKFVLFNFVYLGGRLLYLILLLILLFGVSTRILWIVVATVASEFVVLMVLQALSRRLIPSLTFQVRQINWPVARQLMSFGGWSFIAQIADMIRTAAAPLLLNKLATPLDVTCFYLGSLPYRQIRQFSSAAQLPLMPQLTAMHATNDKARLRNSYLRGGRYGLWACLLIAVPAMVFSQEIIRLYVGNAYSSAALVMLLLLIPFFTVYGHVMFPNLAVATGQMRSLALRVFSVQIINLMLMYYLVCIRQMGAVGAALSICLAMGIGWPILAAPAGLKLSGVRLRIWLRETLFPGVLPGLTTVLFLVIIKYIFEPNTWLGLVVCSMVGILCYVCILLCFSLQKQDRFDLKRVTSLVGVRIPWLKNTGVHR